MYSLTKGVVLLVKQQQIFSHYYFINNQHFGIVEKYD